MPDIVRQSTVSEEAQLRAAALLGAVLSEAGRTRAARDQQRAADAIAREWSARQAPRPPEVPALPMQMADP